MSRVCKTKWIVFVTLVDDDAFPEGFPWVPYLVRNASNAFHLRFFSYCTRFSVFGDKFLWILERGNVESAIGEGIMWGLVGDPTHFGPPTFLCGYYYFVFIMPIGRGIGTSI